MMKRLLNLFVLTQPEQRLIVILVLLLVAGAWLKHHRELQNIAQPQPQGTAVSTPPAN